MSIGNEALTGRDPVAIGGTAIDYSAGDQTFGAFARPPRGVYVGTAGHLKVDMADGSTVTFSNLAVATVYWFSCTKIYQTGSTAAGVVLF